jgi:hypothetical protein
MEGIIEVYNRTFTELILPKLSSGTASPVNRGRWSPSPTLNHSRFYLQLCRYIRYRSSDRQSRDLWSVLPPLPLSPTPGDRKTLQLPAQWHQADDCSSYNNASFPVNTIGFLLIPRRRSVKCTDSSLTGVCSFARLYDKIAEPVKSIWR